MLILLLINLLDYKSEMSGDASGTVFLLGLEILN